MGFNVVFALLGFVGVVSSKGDALKNLRRLQPSNEDSTSLFGNGGHEDLAKGALSAVENHTPMGELVDAADSSNLSTEQQAEFFLDTLIDIVGELPKDAFLDLQTRLITAQLTAHGKDEVLVGIKEDIYDAIEKLDVGAERRRTCYASGETCWTFWCGHCCNGWDPTWIWTGFGYCY